MISAALLAVERFLLPNSCVVCRKMVNAADPDALVCGLCRSRLRVVPLGCDRCRQPMPPIGPCRFCADWPEGFTNATSAVWLDEEAREIVHHLKYEGYRNIAELVATTIYRNTNPPPPLATLVPIPLGARRRVERGYNQAAEIARALSEIWLNPVDETIMGRGRETMSQTTLTPEERARNVMGVFTANSPPLSAGSLTDLSPSVGPESDRYSAVAGHSQIAILVDDVLTTGATLQSAAVALLDAGWKDVKAVTFARALPFAVRMETQC